MSIYDTLMAEDADRGQHRQFRALTARGLTYDTACSAAKGILGAMEPWWNTQSCARIVQELQTNNTLFTCPHEIRCALIPQGQTGACTAAQCSTTPTPCTLTCTPPQYLDATTCTCKTPEPTPTNDNTMLYVGIGAVALVAVYMLTKPSGMKQVNKVLYAKPA